MPNRPRMVEIGEALRSMIAAGSWPLPYELDRRYLTKWTAAELETIRVTLMLMEQDGPALAARGKAGRVWMYDLGIQKKLEDQGIDDEVDELLHFTEQIVDYFAKDGTNGAGLRLVTGYPTAAIRRVLWSPIYSVKDLEKGNFFSHVTLEVSEVRNV